VYFKPNPKVITANAHDIGVNHDIASCIADAPIVSQYHSSSFVSHELIEDSMLLNNIL